MMNSVRRVPGAERHGMRVAQCALNAFIENHRPDYIATKGEPLDRTFLAIGFFIFILFWS